MKFRRTISHCESLSRYRQKKTVQILTDFDKRKFRAVCEDTVFTIKILKCDYKTLGKVGHLVILYKECDSDSHLGKV